MTKPLAITNFDFSKSPAKRADLIRAWVPEIEEIANVTITDDKFKSFLLAAIRLGAKRQSLNILTVEKLSNIAGYSRSTFFRLFESQTQFFLRGYQLSCLLSIKVYEKHLSDQVLDLDAFCTFTTDVFFGANFTISPEIIQFLWRKHKRSQAEFHPHLQELARIMQAYLQQNSPTKNIQIDIDELTAVITLLDLDILTARLENDPLLGTADHYLRLKRLLRGYFLSLNEAAA